MATGPPASSAQTVLVRPPPRVDLVEAKTDAAGNIRYTITRPWQDYLTEALYIRAGGAVAMTNAELEAALNSVELSPLSTAHSTQESEQSLLPPAPFHAAETYTDAARVEALEALVARLQTQVNDLQLGAP